MSENRNVNVLARITDNPQLARAVPQLPPEVLHAVIKHCGLQDCGELLALATAQQLSAVFDLDLWTPSRAGDEEHFDAARFREWLEVLVDAGPESAATQLAMMDATLVAAGLSSSVTVWDPAVFSSVIEESGADAVLNAGRERGVHAEIGGYVVVARAAEGWDAIVDVLVALDAHHPEVFHRVMRACRQLSNSGREIDGLDDLLTVDEQAHFDLSLSREQRRDRLGYLPAPQARAFLASARRVSFEDGLVQDDPVFAAYRCSLNATSEAETHSTLASADAYPDESTAVATSDVTGVIEALRDAGVLNDAPRALLPAARDEGARVNSALSSYLQLAANSDDVAWIERKQELAFLANALAVGCSIQGRAFSPREATDAVAATCNLGLEHWPRQWRSSSEQSLVAVFQVGWTVLHREVSIAAADGLLDALAHVRSSDREMQFGLEALRRELRAQRQRGTPWRVRNRLEILSTFDLPAWAALTALFDECPVMLANVCPPEGRPPRTLNPSEFQFIAHASHIAAVHLFLATLTDLLTN